MALINVKWPYWYDAFFAQVSPNMNTVTNELSLT